MTLEANDRRYTYAGNGVTTVFTGPRAFDSTHIAVYLINDDTGATTTVDTDDYDLGGIGDDQTAVTMDTAPASNYTLLILRTVPYTQETDITNQGRFLPSVLENALDWVVMQIQQLKEYIDTQLAIITGTTDPATVDPDTILNFGTISYLIPIRTIADTTKTVDFTYTSALSLCTNASPVSVTVRANDGDDELDFQTGTFMSFKQVTAGGQVSLLADAGVTLQVPVGFLAKTRAMDSIITATCEFADADVWVVSGDLAIDPSASSGQAVTPLTSASGVLAIDCSLGDFFTITLTENVTSITFSNVPDSGFAQRIRLRITQHASSPKTMAWPASFKWPSGSAGTISNTNSAVDVLEMTTFDQGTRWEAGLTKGYA